jgi:Sec-independent protein translocase protein TatA
LLSPADMLILGAAALLFFGPDQLPKVARRAGHVMRDIQSTSQSFIREMERAADEAEFKENAARVEAVPYVAEPPVAESPVNEPPIAEPGVAESSIGEPAPDTSHAAEPAPAEPAKSETLPPEKVSG